MMMRSKGLDLEKETFSVKIENSLEKRLELKKSFKLPWTYPAARAAGLRNPP